MTKRQAIAAIFMGVLAKMAHADEPSKTAPEPSQPWTFSLLQNPTSWFVNLDTMKDLQITLGANKVTLTAAEIFAALEKP